MSGSGSGGGFGSGGAGGKSVDCENFSFETHIHSPNQFEISKLSVGDILKVTLSVINGVEVVQIVNNSNIVGGLVEQGNKIRQCLELGFHFDAHVRSISGAAVRIFVQSQGL